jgi:hypothetical protein
VSEVVAFSVEVMIVSRCIAAHMLMVVRNHKFKEDFESQVIHLLRQRALVVLSKKCSAAALEDSGSSQEC